MSDRPSGITFAIFRYTLIAVIFVESAITVYHSLHSSTQSHLGTILPWFAGAEAVAALLLLLIPRSVTIAGGILLVVFAVALVVHGPAEQTQLFVYAAGVIFLMANDKARPADKSRSNFGGDAGE